MSEKSCGKLPVWWWWPANDGVAEEFPSIGGELGLVIVSGDSGSELRSRGRLENSAVYEGLREESADMLLGVTEPVPGLLLMAVLRMERGSRSSATETSISELLVDESMGCLRWWSACNGGGGGEVVVVGFISTVGLAGEWWVELSGESEASVVVESEEEAEDEDEDESEGNGRVFICAAVGLVAQLGSGDICGGMNRAQLVLRKMLWAALCWRVAGGNCAMQKAGAGKGGWKSSGRGEAGWRWW